MRPQGEIPKSILNAGFDSIDLSTAKQPSRLLARKEWSILAETQSSIRSARPKLVDVVCTSYNCASQMFPQLKKQMIPSLLYDESRPDHPIR